MKSFFEPFFLEVLGSKLRITFQTTGAMTDGSFRDQVHEEMMRRLNQQAEEFQVNAEHVCHTPPQARLTRTASERSNLDAETLFLGDQSDDHHEEEGAESEEMEDDQPCKPDPEKKGEEPSACKIKSKPDPEIKSKAKQSKPDPEIKSTAKQSKPDPEMKPTVETPWVDLTDTFQASEEEPAPVSEHELPGTAKKPASTLQAAAKGKAVPKGKAKAKSVFKRPASESASKADGSKPLKRPAASPSTPSTPMKRPAGAGTGAEPIAPAPESVATDPKTIDMSKWIWTDSDDSGRESIHGDWKAWACSVHQSFDCFAQTVNFQKMDQHLD